MENNVVYVVIISDEWGEVVSSIHSIYSSLDLAQKIKQELESSLGNDMVAYVETHEVFDK